MNRKLVILTGIAIFASLVGGYFLSQKIQQDRQQAMTYSGMPDHIVRRSEPQEGRTTRTYTTKELEEARKKGQLPNGVQTNNPSQAATANDAAVQRTLQTIQEINRINEMNQRLQEQQQRLNKQK